VTKPKIVVDITGGVVQSIVSTHDIDIMILDFDEPDAMCPEDPETNEHRVTIDQYDAYVINHYPVEVKPNRTKALFELIQSQLKKKTQKAKK
jgi:hypothetical protein